jgi:UDP-3-O-[3-hydroxymyristoyl] glucosamine N-acyltransferase
LNDQSSTANTVVTAETLARKVGGEIRGRADTRIHGVNSVEQATNGEVTFVSSARYARLLESSRASAALITGQAASLLSPRTAARLCLIIVPDAELAMDKALDVFQPREDQPALGTHASAVVDGSVKMGKDVRIGAHVTVAAECVLGDGVILHPGVRLYSGVHIGAGSVLHANVVVRERCRIGRNVILHANVSIGTDGFGYRTDASGRGIAKITHIGTVIIEDEVEIGANSCVDRGKFGATVIGACTKIDNLCQIAHNCRIGRCCVIAGQSGMGGSVTVGDGVKMGGKTGIIDHLTIGERAELGARCTVLTDVPANSRWTGYPAGEGREVLRQWASIRKLPDLLRRLSRRLPAEPGDS